MAKKLTREVTTTAVRVALIEAINGEVRSTEQDMILVEGNPSDKVLHNILVDKFPEKQFIILERESNTTKYEMEVLEFIKYATPIGDYDGFNGTREEDAS